MIWPHSTRLSQLIAINLANYSTRAVRFPTKPTVSVPADWQKKCIFPARRTHDFVFTDAYSHAACAVRARGEKAGAAKLNYHHRGYLIPTHRAAGDTERVLRMHAEREMIREAAGHAHWTRRIETHTRFPWRAYWSRNPPDGAQIVICAAPRYKLSMPLGEIE